MDNFPVRIYAADVRPLENENLFRMAYEKVTEERRRKTDRMRCAGDKRLSLGAELLLMHGLFQTGVLKKQNRSEGGFGKEAPDFGYPESGLTPDTLRFRYGENGKPYLENVRGIYFNVSHSGDLAVCAIAPCETGCDVEKIRDRGLAVARRFFAPEEYEMIAGLEDEQARQEMFCRFWTLKESFLKTVGQGLRLGLDSFRIIPEEEKISVIQNIDRRTYYFREYEAAEGYRCAVCAVGESFEEKIRRVDITDMCL